MQNQSTLESLFAQAVELDNEAKREAFLAASCGHDAALRKDLDELLAAHGEAASFMASPASGLAATALQPNIRETPGMQIGPYKLLEQIGEGGMGLVFVAEQTQPLRRRVALKIIKPGLDTRAVIARFEAERQALALMDHPNIARVYDAGATESGRPYFVMELVRGSPITDYCREQGLGIRPRLELFLDVCRAVQHAHQKGVIHRDLKPTNILVTQSDTAPIPKVIDFGVAKATAAQSLTDKTLFTAFSQIVGTPLYMSPEQAELRNQDIDTRSDVYSLGVVLYELLTGATPFDAERLRSAGHDEMRRIIREEEPPKPSTRATTIAAATTVEAPHDRKQADVHVSALKGDLDWIVMKSLDKDRRRRYESPAALAADILRHLNDEPIEAAAPSAWYQAQKFLRRHRMIAASVATIALILIAATAVSTMWALRASRAGRAAGESGEAAQKARQRAETALAEAESARNQTAWYLYATQMNQAATAWESLEFGALQSLLADTKPDAQAPDHRGWEWYFLKRQHDHVFAATPSAYVWRVAWRPQKKEFAVAVSGKRAEIQIWAPDAAQPLRTVAEISTNIDNKPVEKVTRMVWSADGKRLACSFYPPEDSDGGPDQGNWVTVVDVDSGKTLFCREVTRDADVGRFYVKAIALNPAGTMLAVGNWYGQIKIYDVARSVVTQTIHDPQSWEGAPSLAFSPSGEYLAATRGGGRRTVWNLTTGDKLDYAPTSLGEDHGVVWSPDGSQFATTNGSAVVIYQLGDAQPIASLPHEGLTSVCWPNPSLVVSSGYDHHFKAWNAEEQTAVQVASLKPAPIWSVEVSTDGKYLATCSYGALLVARLEDLGRGRVIKAVKPEVGTAKGNLVRWSRDGLRLASGCSMSVDHNTFYSIVRVVDLTADRDVVQQNSRIIRAFDWSPDDASLLVVGHHREFHEISIDDPESTTLRPADGPGTYGPSDVSHDGQWIARVVDPDAEEGGHQLEISSSITHEVRTRAPADSGMRTVSWSPDSSAVFFASDTEWRLLDVEAGTAPLFDLRRKPEIDAKCSDWDPSSSLVAVGIADGSIEIWSRRTSTQIIQLMGHQGMVSGLDWSSDGRRIASSGADGTIRIWDAATGDAVAVFHGPPGLIVDSVAWSPDCRQLAAGVANGDILLFDAGDTMPQNSYTAPSASGKIAEALAVPR